MNDIQKLALHKFHPKLLHDLDLNADLVGKFIHHGIFNEDMIEEFKCEKTRRGQVQKMLLQLPRRGPRAFDLFIHAIQHDYHWLAHGLREKHHKLTLQKDPVLVSLKEKVDIFVHEHFGNSKRLCEEDKKSIRLFVYKHLKENAHSQDNKNNKHPQLENRRDSIDSTSIQDLEQVLQNKILQKVYTILNKDSATGPCVDSDEEHSEVDSTDISLDMIENRVNELNKIVEDLQQEVEDMKHERQECFSVLGLDNCEYSLHDVLETYTEKRTAELEGFSKCKEKLEKLEKKRTKLEEELKSKEKELKDYMKNLAIVEHEKEKSESLIEKLKDKCTRLEQLHMKHAEKEQTLIHLKNMVNDLGPLHRQRQRMNRFPADEVDGHAQHTDLLQLPPLGTRSIGMSQSHHSRSTERRGSIHHEIPGFLQDFYRGMVQENHGNNRQGKPWK